MLQARSIPVTRAPVAYSIEVETRFNTKMTNLYHYKVKTKTITRYELCLMLAFRMIFKLTYKYLTYTGRGQELLKSVQWAIEKLRNEMCTEALFLCLQSHHIAIKQ